MSAILRLARPEDARRIFELICDLATFEEARDEVRTTPATLETQLRSPNPPFECLLREEEGAVIGFALFFNNYSTWEGSVGIHLEDLYVEPRQRGKGHGRALFRRVCQIAHERGHARVEWAALNWNTHAIEFYRAFGATALDEWTTFRLAGAQLAAAAQSSRLK